MGTYDISPALLKEAREQFSKMTCLPAQIKDHIEAGLGLSIDRTESRVKEWKGIHTKDTPALAKDIESLIEEDRKYIHLLKELIKLVRIPRDC